MKTIKNSRLFGWSLAIIILLSFIVTFNTKYNTATTIVSFIVGIVLLIKISRGIVWKERLLPNIIGGMIGGLLIASFTIDKIQVNWQIFSLILIIIYELLFFYFAYYGHINLKRIEK